MSPRPSSRHPMAVALEWVSRVFVVAIEMVAPGVLGAYLDTWFGTSFLALVGFGVGIPLGVFHLIVMTQPRRT